MKLFTQEIDRKLFSQYNLGSDLSKQMVVAKIFNPYGAGRWFLINSDPQDPDYLWAIVDLFDIEVGSVSRTELQSIRIGKHSLPLERDLYFKPINAQELLNGLMQGDYYKKGGLVHNQNKEMLENQAKEFMHHSKELNSLVGKTKDVDAWVVAKAERATTDLSDITHYLDGRMENGGMMSNEVLLETYKGYGIVDRNGVISVVSPSGSRFIVGLDDSKMSGSRKSIEMTREQELASAKDYIDWLTKSKMAKGGNIKKEYKVGDRVIYAPNGKFFGAKGVSYMKKAEITNVEEISGTKLYTLEIKNKYGQVINKFETSNLKELQIDPDFEMAKGGMLKAILVHKEFGVEYYKNGSLIQPTKQEKLKWEVYGLPNDVEKIEESFETTIDEFVGKTKKEIQSKSDEKIRSGKYNYLGTNPNLNLIFDDKMEMGGATFQDKVNAISKRLEGTKVPTRLKKDYGATYDKKEAKQAGQRIAGSMIKKLKMKMKNK